MELRITITATSITITTHGGCPRTPSSLSSNLLSAVCCQACASITKLLPNHRRLHYPHQLHTEVALPNYVQLEPHGGYGPGRYPPPASYGAQPRYPPPPPRHHNVPQPVLHQGPPVAYQNSRQHSSSGRGPSTSAKRSSSSQSMMPAPAKRPKLASGMQKHETPACWGCACEEDEAPMLGHF